MNKIQKMALNEIKEKSNVVSMNLYKSKADLTSIKNELMHCDPNMSKEYFSNLVLELHKVINYIDESTSSVKSISSWADALDENN